MRLLCTQENFKNHLQKRFCINRYNPTFGTENDQTSLCNNTTRENLYDKSNLSLQKRFYGLALIIHLV